MRLGTDSLAESDDSVQIVQAFVQCKRSDIALQGGRASVPEAQSIYHPPPTPVRKIISKKL